jgi:hypothetical protein
MGKIDALYFKRSGIQGKGAIDLNVKNPKSRVYGVVDTIQKARSPHICDCCGTTIEANTPYVRRTKQFYADKPTAYQICKLCVKCADSA